MFEAGSNRLNVSLQTGSYQPGEISTNTEEHPQAVLMDAQHATKLSFRTKKASHHQLPKLWKPCWTQPPVRRVF